MSAQGVDDFPHVAVVWVEIEQNGEEQYRWVDQVRWYCLAPEWAACRVYPDCDDEEFDCGHPAVPGRPCWIVDWLQACGEELYEGDDHIDGSPPRVPRVGQITATWEGDYLAWKWAS